MSYTRKQFREALKSTEMKAFLHVIRVGEGTLGEHGYSILFGGERFAGFDDHPRLAVTKRHGGKTLTSTAAGAYQFLSKTWDWIRGIYGFEDFSPRNQDEAAVALIAHRGALADVLAGRVETALAKCAKEWASLPGSPYGQPTLSLDKALGLYAKYSEAAPVVDAVIVPSSPTKVQAEEGMNPFVIAAASKAIEFAPDLVRMFGGNKAERNAQLAEKVVEIAQSVTGQANAQAAMEALEVSPDLQAGFREKVYAERLELEKLADRRVEAARDFVSNYRKGETVLGSFTLPELLSSFFVFGGYGLGVAVIFFTDLSAELKAAVVGALVVQAVSDVRGFWFGNSASKEQRK